MHASFSRPPQFVRERKRRSMAESQIPTCAPLRRWEWGVLIAILIAATALRVWQLGSVPPGLTHDEASNGHDAAAVLRGVRPIYFTVGYGHEPLYPYSVAAVMALLGPTDTALRLTTVGWGLALIVVSYAFTWRLFGPLPAVFTAVWMAVSFWCVMTSRVGLRAITSAVTFTASAFCFWQAFPRLSRRIPRRTIRNSRSEIRSSQSAVRNWAWWALSGIFLGASIYTYMASRAMPAVYFLFLIYLLVLHALGVRPSLFQEQWIGVLGLLLIAGLVATPLVHFLITHPGAEQRLAQLSEPLKLATRGDFSGVWRRVSRTLPMFTFRGDPLWLYNIPGRPLLDVVGGALFYAGLLLCAWRWRDPCCAFLLIWLIVGVSPALITGPDATVLRSIVAQPAVFIIASLALATAVRFLWRHSRRWARAVTVGGVAVLFALIGLRAVHAYFSVWAEHPDVRVAYHHALVQEARYLDSQPEDGAVALSSIYPGRFHDPYTMEIMLRRDDLSLRWFDGRFALVFPAERETRVIIPSIARLDETLRPVFEEHASLVHTEHFRGDDLIRRFDVYQFDAHRAMATLLPEVNDRPVYWSASDAFPADALQAGYEPLSLPVNVGDAVELLGYDLRTPLVEPGGGVELLTVWRVRERLASEVVLFTHLLDHSGEVVGQIDRLDVPSWHWRPGDAFVQLHRFQIDAQASAGLHHVEVGVYTRDDLARLPVIVDGSEVDDRILLSPIEVAADE